MFALTKIEVLVIDTEASQKGQLYWGSEAHKLNWDKANSITWVFLKP